MKKIVMTSFVLCILFASCDKKSSTETSKDMNTLSFTTEQAACMSAIACLEAKADYMALEQAIHNGLDAGLTVNQIKEAFSHLYAYTGFPRSLNALGTLQKVLEQRNAEGKTTVEGEEASPLPKNFDALKVVRDRFTAAGFELYALEGDEFDMSRIKLGLPGRDEDLEKYRKMLRNMGKLGLKLL